MTEKEPEKGQEEVTIINIGNGAAVELFDRELQNVLMNVADINTQPEALREITLKITLKPTEDRTMAQVLVQATSKLAPFAPGSARIFLGKQSGRFLAVAHDPQQMKLFEPLPLTKFPVPAGGNKE